MSYSSKREQEQFYDFQEKIETYKQICEELHENPTSWPIVSNDGTMLDEILIHTKKEDLRPIHKEFAKRLIKRLIKKCDFFGDLFGADGL